ncbi:MAG TPA: GTPase HflX, partial [Longimicrobiaceae bacterium]|nr:GTPase HflX [Longimicrobiaceae bacterium]
MIELEQPRERAILVGAPPKSIGAEAAEEHLEELGRLADTAGVEIVGTVTQRLESPSPRLYIGEGKAAELRDEAEAAGATLALFDEELSPAQGKNLEDLTGLRIMDRAELILDIFATRARTAEAKMQVELAQLQYMLPRLTRMWAHLSRIRGGVGMRGPGETQLETDRRMIRVRIARLKKDLAQVRAQRETQRKGRGRVMRAALVGYTNAGKSSILRGLSADRDVFVEDRLFATLDAATRAVDLGEGYEALLTDTVGFIRKLPHHLVASFRATLEEAGEADVLLHVIDASHSGWEEQKQVVDEVLTDLGLAGRPQLLVFNKVDRLTHEEEEAWRERAAVEFGRPAVFVSAVEEGGLEPLRAALRDEVRARRAEVEIVLPMTAGAVLAEIYREGEVLDREERDSKIVLRARVPAPALGRLRARPGV